MNSSSDANNVVKSITESKTSDFSQSNSYVYKIMYVFLLCIVGFIILSFGINWITTTTTTSEDETIVLLNGTIDAQTPVTISQSPTQNRQLIVSPSRNLPGGLEFTWSVWIYITSLESSSLYSNVFFKGVYTSNTCNNINELTNGPGLYLLNNSETNSATLYVVMDTFSSPGGYINGLCNMSNSIQIPYIPIGEWVNVGIGCMDRNIDIYINGLIASSTTLTGIPKQNNGDIYIAHNKGFQGKISTLQYFPRKLTITDIRQVYNKGPILTLVSPPPLSSSKSAASDYLSFGWYIK